MSKKVTEMSLAELDKHIEGLEDEKDALREKTLEAVQVRKNLLADNHLRQKLSNLKLSENELLAMGVAKDKAKAMAAKPKEQVATPLPVQVGASVQKPKAAK